MLLSAVSVLVVAQSSSEIPEGLMNNPVYLYVYLYNTFRGHSLHNLAMKVNLEFINNDERPANWLSFKK